MGPTLRWGLRLCMWLLIQKNELKKELKKKKKKVNVRENLERKV